MLKQHMRCYETIAHVIITHCVGRGRSNYILSMISMMITKLSVWVCPVWVDIMTIVRVINDLNNAHCVMYECYHTQVVARAKHAPNFPKQIFIMELAPVANDEVKYSWILDM